MTSLNELGFIRAGVAVPELQIANPSYNRERMMELIKKANEQKVQVLVFPELSLTGYSAGDLFNQKILLDSAEKELTLLRRNTRILDMFIVLGMPIRADNQLFNCAVVLHEGKILGVVPKTFIPNYNEFYEKRWFASSLSRISDHIILAGQDVPFSENLIFKDKCSDLTIGVEICEDLWMPIPPSSFLTQYGANLILNLSASNEIVGKAEYRRELVKGQSARCMTGYLYASAGQNESTTDIVFGGHAMIAENGTLLKESRMNSEETLLIQDIDIERLMNDRRKFNTFMGKVESKSYQIIPFELENQSINQLFRTIDPHPFVPASKNNRDERCEEIFKIQATGLAQRLKKSGVQKAVIGISGGLDSTLALLVTYQAFQQLKRSPKDIIGVTMPGYGTSNRTHDNSLALMKWLGITSQEISIIDACNQHMKDIGHDPNKHDVTYENIQARERTQILMDISNQEGGLVVGTGDLSELALGWATYNGDHMSMYAVNASIPKTLVRYLVNWYAETTTNSEVAKALKDILDTPISPELLPLDKEGKIQQKTESLVGPYELHDFYLYNMLRFGFSPLKILFLAETAFPNYERETLVHWLKFFYKRFFTQQFKRSCLPDGVKVGSIALSPRGDWRMPSDASYGLWLKELEECD